MKKLFLLFVFTCLVVFETNGQDAITNSVIALVNAARNEAGIPSLLISSELTQAAQRHSNDMANTKTLDHVGSDGSEFWVRMKDAGYNLSSGAENLLLRSDTNAQGVFNQWWSSRLHRGNMMNSDYVEIGVAYAQAADRTYYFTMLLGRREGITAPPIPSPTTILPTSTPLPPTSTPVPPTETMTPLPTETSSPTPPIPPTRTLSPLITPVAFTPMPTKTATNQPTSTPELTPDIRLVYDRNSLTLLNISGQRLDLTGISFMSDSGEMDVSVWDTEYLTEPLNNFSDRDCLQVWGLELNLVQDKVPACETRHGWTAVNNTQLFWKDTVSFLVLSDNEYIGQCRVVDGICDVSLDAKLSLTANELIASMPTDRDIRLIFTQDSFTLLSIADVPIDLSGIVFQSSSGTLRIEAWNTEFLTASLSGFPPDSCLMAWVPDVGEQSVPSECETRHGWIVAGDPEGFWRGVSRFDVIRGNRVLAGCVIANGFCDVNLAGNLGANSPTLVSSNPAATTGTPVSDSFNGSAVVSSGFDLTFVYSFDKFALINTSGRTLDISGLVFESDTGVFAANRWNTDFLTRSLGDFPSGDCLQVWGVNEQLQSKPAGCDTRHGWVAVPPDVQFWRNASQLRIRNGAAYLATCDLRAGQCAANLP